MKKNKKKIWIYVLISKKALSKENWLKKSFFPYPRVWRRHAQLNRRWVFSRFIMSKVWMYIVHREEGPYT